MEILARVDDSELLKEMKEVIDAWIAVQRPVMRVKAERWTSTEAPDVLKVRFDKALTDALEEELRRGYLHDVVKREVKAAVKRWMSGEEIPTQNAAYFDEVVKPAALRIMKEYIEQDLAWRIQGDTREKLRKLVGDALAIANLSGPAVQ